MYPAVLIIDDEPAFIKKMRFAFKELNLSEALNIKQARSYLNNHDFDLILLDLKLNAASEKLDGLNLIGPIKNSFPNTPLVVITSDERTETVVSAMKCGADDFLRKSNFDLLSWKKKFDLLIQNKKLALENRLLIENESGKYPFIGNSKAISEIKKTLDELARKPEITVLITGETGVGKEVAARYIHRNSDRKNKPFVHVNLSSIQPTLLESSLFGHRKGSFTGAEYTREGFFRRADKGIIFLDEIGDIDSNIQVKILNFLENKTIQVVGDDSEIQLDVQIIVATNKDLTKLVSENTFRKDLYYRIKNFKIEIPPLRYRREDIEEILKYYLSQQGYTNIDEILEPEVKNTLLNYNWPGNVRELKNTVDSFLLKKRILHKLKVDFDCLPIDIIGKNAQSLRSNFEERNDVEKGETFKLIGKENVRLKIAKAELDEIEKALERSFGQKKIAAEIIGMSADQLRYRVLKWNNNYPLYVKKKYPIITKYYKLDNSYER